MLSDWPEVLETLHSRHRANTPNFFQDRTLADFVTDLALADRTPFLLAAYTRYRELGPPSEEFDSEHNFKSSIYSILISLLLSSQVDATEDAACAILRASFHFCGHGGDVLAPIRLAERAFTGKPYTAQLFDAALVYRQTLKGLAAVQAQLAKQELSWILWHDPRHPEKHCWTRVIQLSLAVMPRDEAFAWQWMLRHTTHALNRPCGKIWLVEAERRMELLGANRYRDRLDQWFVFPRGEPIRLSPAGSNVLRLVVSYGALAPKALPALSRLKSVKWAAPANARKVMTSLAWLQERR